MKSLLILAGSILVGLILMFLFTDLSAPKSTQPLVQPISPSSTPQSNFSIANAPSQTLKAEVLSTSGQISFESRVATVAAQVKTLSQIQQGENVATGPNSNLTARIPGQLTTFLSAQTKLEFVQTLPENIVLNQDSGQVEYQRLGSDPLSVRAIDLLVDVSGTDLIVTISSDQSQVRVEAIKGSAKIGYNDANDFSTVKELSQGDTLIFDEDTKTSTVI